MDFEQIKNQFLQKGREALDFIRSNKPSEKLGIPYAKEINKSIQKNIDLGSEQLPIAFERTTRQLSKIPAIIQSQGRPSERLGIPFAEKFNKFITGETSKEQQNRALVELANFNKIDEDLARRKSEIDKKYGVTNLYSPEGVISGLAGTVPSLTGQLIIPGVILTATKNLPLAISTSRAFATTETYTKSYLEAVKEGATPEQANNYSLINSGVTYGLSKLPVESLFKGLSKPIQQKASESFKKNMSKELLRISKTAGTTGLSEMTEEVAQQLVSNVAKVTYKDLKDVNLTEGLTESAFLGFIGGGVIGTGGALLARPGLDVSSINNFPAQTFNREINITNKNIVDDADKFNTVEEIDANIKSLQERKNNTTLSPDDKKKIDTQIAYLKSVKLYKETQIKSGVEVKQPTEKVSFQTNNNKQTVELNNNQVILKNDFGKGKTVETTIDLDKWNTLDKTKKIALLRKSYFDAKKGIVNKDDLEFYFFYSPDGKTKSNKVDKVIEYSINNIDKLVSKYKNLPQQQVTPTETPVTPAENNLVVEPEPTPLPSEVTPEPQIKSVEDVVQKIEDAQIKEENNVAEVPTSTPNREVDIDQEVNNIERLLSENKPDQAIDYLKKLPLEKGERVYKFFERVAEGRTDLDPKFVLEIKSELLKYQERNLSKEVKERIEQDSKLVDEITKIEYINSAEDLLRIVSDVQELVDNNQLNNQLFSQEVYNRVFEYMRANQPNETNVNLFVESLYNKLSNNGQKKIAEELSASVRGPIKTASGQSVNLQKYFLNAEEVVKDVTGILLKGISNIKDSIPFIGRNEAQTKDLNNKIENITTEIGNKLGFLRNQFSLDLTSITEVYNKIKDLSVEEVNRIYKLTGDPQQDTLKQNIDVVEDLTKLKEIDSKLENISNPETNKNSDILSGIGITGKDKNKFTGKSNQKKRKLFDGIDDDPEGETKDPFEILANKFERDIELYLNGKPAKYKDVVKQMIAQLYKVGKEKLPNKFLDTPEGKIISLYENLRLALKNVNEYSEVWNEAKVIIYDKYGGDPKVEAILIDFFNRDIPNVFSDSDAKRVYKDLIKQNNIKFKDLVKTTLQNINSTKETLKQSLLENLELDIKTAETLVDEVYKLFDADVKKAINTPGYLTKLRPSTPELVLNKVDKDIDELLKGKPEAVIESFKRQVRRLAKVAKERLPFDKKLQREKSNNEFFKDLGIALKDYRDYRYNWARFRQMLSQKYQYNQEVLNLTKDILGTNLFDVFTPSEFNRVFSIVKKDLGISFNNLVKQTDQDIEAKRIEAENYLLNKLGVTKEEAGSLLFKFAEEFNNQVIISRNRGQAIRIEQSNAEKVADKLFAYSENTRANQESKQIANDVISQYLRIARGFFQNIGDTTKLSPEQKYKLLKDSIRKISKEQKQYYKLHQDALNLVKEKYKNNPIALEQLEEYFNGIIPGSFTRQQVKQVFNNLTSDINFVDLVKSHFSKRTETIKDLEIKIMNEFGLSQKDATRISNEVYAKFNQKYENTIRNEINKRLKAIEKYAQGKQYKDINQKFVEYVNLGFFNSKELANIAKNVFNLPVLTPRIQNIIETEIWKMQTGEQSITDAYINISKELIKAKPFSWKNIFKKAQDFNLVRRQIFYTNILSGIQTFLRNAYGFVFEVPMRGVQITTEAIINSLRRRLGFSEEQFGYELRDVPTYYIEMLQSIRQATNNAINVWNTNYVPRTATQFSEKEFGLEKIYEVLYGKQTWIGLRIVANGLEMVDQFGMTMVTSAESAILQSKGMSKEEADKQGQETAKRLFLREDIMEGSPEEIKAKIGAIDSWINKFTKWVLKAKQNENIIAQTTLDLIFPIVTIGSNLLKQKLERNLIAQGIKIGTKLQYKGTITTRDMASLVIAFGLFIVAWKAFMDGDIQGELPDDEEDRRRAEEAGRKRNSVKLGNFWIPFQYLGSNASMFEWFAALQDTKDSKQFLERNNVENFLATVVNVLLKVGNETALRGLIDINKGLTVDNAVSNKTINNMVTNSILNSFMLYRSFFRDLAEINDEYKRKYEGIIETAMSGIPEVRKQLEPKYDYYGQPIKETFDSTILPYPVGVNNEEKNEEFLRLLKQAQFEVQARNLPEVKEFKNKKEIAKGQLRKILEEGINNPQSFNEASKIIKENNLSSEDVTSVQNKILDNKLNNELPPELKGYTTLTKDQLQEVSKSSPELKKQIDTFNKLEESIKKEIKLKTLDTDKVLRKIASGPSKSRRVGIRLPKIKKPKKFKLKVPKLNKKKSSRVKKVKLKTIKLPKLKLSIKN